MRVLLGDSTTGSGNALGSDSGCEDDMTIAVPRNIGRFVVLRRVGRGGMGEVFSAYDEQLERRVAVKLLHKRPNARKSRQARMHREAQAMARVSHPNVVQVFEVGEFQDRTFIAMEYIEGQTLSRWQRVTVPPRAALLDAYLQAGAGLAAAHRAGVLHRDFKPSNAIIDESGRVRVTDFGLAAWLQRADLSVTDGVGIGGPEQISDVSEHPGRPRLTVAGALVGTPAFMSPEQYERKSLDARADQFAFCVSLFEALVGQHPFGGTTTEQLRESIVGGRLLEAPSGRSLPQPLRRVLRRGLAKDRRERWPSMEALLDALRPRPRRARRVWLTAALGGLVAGGIGYWGLLAPSQLCSGAPEQMGRVWNATQRSAAEKGLDRSGIPLAASTWRRVEARIEDYAGRWEQTRTRTCEATHVRGEQSPELMDQRMACLDLRLQAVESLLGTFEDADVETVLRAVEATAALPKIELCEKLGTASPVDPESSRIEAVALRHRLISARANLSVGRFPLARAQLQRIRDDARAADLPRLAAEALVRRGEAERGEGLVKRADRTLEEGLWEAMGAGADEAAFDAALGHMLVVGTLLVDRPRGLAGLERAEALLIRLGNDDSHRIEFLSAAAGVLVRDGQYREARERIDAAVILARRMDEDDHVILADVLGVSGTVALWSDELDLAERTFHEVIEIDRRFYDPKHTRLASPLNNLAIVSARKGDLAAANERFTEAYELHREALGEDHVLVGDSTMNLAGVAMAQGRTEDAIVQLARARAIYARSLGEGVPKTNEADLARGLALVGLGRDDEAERIFRDVIARQRIAMGERHPDLVRSLGPLGRLLIRTGRGPEAVEVLGVAVELERAKAVETGVDPATLPDFEDLRAALDEARALEGHRVAGEPGEPPSEE